MDLFDIQKGRKPTKWQLFLYRCVNVYFWRFLALLFLLAAVGFVAGLVYVVVHFVVKYW